jgi:hypothetical protein
MSTAGSPGDTVLVFINCINTFSIAGVSYRITYEENNLEIISVDTTARSNGFDYSLFNIDASGAIRYVGTSYDPMNNLILPGSGSINVIKARILENAQPGYCYFRFENTDSTSFENALSDSTGYDIIIPIYNDGYVYVSLTGIDGDNYVIQPSSLELLQNYPNPFNMDTRISFVLENRNNVTLDVYNLLGEKVNTLYEGQAEAGETTVLWNGLSSSGEEVTSGVYFYRLAISDGRSITKRMSLIK